MSSTLHRLGRAVAHRPGLVLVVWLLVLSLSGGAAALLQKGTDDTVDIPGASSMDALHHLQHVFPELSGTSAQLVLLAPPGTDVDTPAARAAVRDALTGLLKVDQVIYAPDPFAADAKDGVSRDHRAAMINVFLRVDLFHVTPTTREQIQTIARGIEHRVGGGLVVHVGGDAFGDRIPKLSTTEALGLVVALVVLLVMFGSLVASGLPLLTALLGVGVAMGAVYAATGFTAIMSTTPMLAVMLGLAVGIDYSLFILSRHREQLATGLDVRESVARATATAGSAVVVAGLTVIIALIGLFVAGIPFLTSMGIAAAWAVLVAVLVALTATPALLALAGERLRPRRRKTSTESRHRIANGWVTAVTRFPLVTVLVVVAGLGVCALPARDLNLSLPDNGTLDEGVPARVTYDVVDEHFGPGFNAPMLLMVDVLPSTDPITVTNQIAAEVAELPNVAAVPFATPNRKGDTAVIEVIPGSAADARETVDVARRLRDLAPHIRERYGLTSTVTGMTVATIDISERLRGSLLPFGGFVVGLSLLLLAMVFRSVAVPVKATLGYALSVGAAFGATNAVFGHGVAADALRVQHVGSVISFLPIILMGVLFGLAMDYEMFLVSRIREHYVHHGDAQEAIRAGFVAASPVVTAAALIMLGVFAAFVPDGSSTVKPIAFGLAVGVFVDAFIVRMTLVPAALALLGRAAWWLPAGLGRRLPAFDVEGEGLVRILRLHGDPDATSATIELDDTGDDDEDDAGTTPDERPAVHHRPLVQVAGLVLRDDRGRALTGELSFTVAAGEILLLTGLTAAAGSGLLLALGGRLAAVEGDLVVGPWVLPDQRRLARRRVAVVRCRDARPELEVREALADGVHLILLDELDLVVDPDERAALRDLFAAAIEQSGHGGHGTAVIATCSDPTGIEKALAGLPGRVLGLPGEPDPTGSPALIRLPSDETSSPIEQAGQHAPAEVH